MIKYNRTLLATVAVIVMTAATLYLWNSYPSMTPAEHRLVGSWTTKTISADVSINGPMTNRLLVWEFRRDHTFLMRVDSPDDPDASIPETEGRWHATEDHLRLESFGAASGLFREIRERGRLWFYGTYLSRVEYDQSISIRFLDEATFEMTPEGLGPRTWRRRP